MADGLDDLERDLDRAVERADEEARKVVSKGSLNIKNDTRDTWKRELRGGHAKLLHYSVGYDMSQPGGDEIISNIGPDADNKRMQGPLGGIIENGTISSAPIPALTSAWLDESPRFEDAMGDMGERLLAGE